MRRRVNDRQRERERERASERRSRSEQFWWVNKQTRKQTNKFKFAGGWQPTARPASAQSKAKRLRLIALRCVVGSIVAAVVGYAREGKPRMKWQRLRFESPPCAQPLSERTTEPIRRATRSSTPERRRARRRGADNWQPLRTLGGRRLCSICRSSATAPS